MGAAPLLWPPLLFVVPTLHAEILSPEQQWAEENSLGSVESPTLSSSACNTDPGPVGPAPSQPREMTPTPAPILSGSANLPVQKPDPVPPGCPEPPEDRGGDF